MVVHKITDQVEADFVKIMKEKQEILQPIQIIKEKPGLKIIKLHKLRQ